jgi:hypothetical protein
MDSTLNPWYTGCDEMMQQVESDEENYSQKGVE